MNHSSFSQDERDGGGDDDDAPLSERVLSVVRDAPDLTIRPSRLAAALGVSVDDASAELCGLLAAVGEGASFAFETDATTTTTNAAAPPVMVFTFPPDFEARARRHERYQRLSRAAEEVLASAVRTAKVVTAFGLILSLTVLGVAAAVVLLSVLFVGTTRGGSQNHRGNRQLHAAVGRHLVTLRQLLWCYYVFGDLLPSSWGGGDHHHGGGEESAHPFFQEVAGILAGCLTIFAGGGLSPFYWMRWSRRRRWRRGRARWGRSRWDENDHGIDGVHLLNAGTWRDEIRQGANASRANDDDDPWPGLLSIAVEFLFGPTNGDRPGPSERARWRLRAYVILKSENATLSLDDLAPYVDDPFAGPNAALPVVAHFNGVPATLSDGAAAFRFPELAGEGANVGAPDAAFAREVAVQEEPTSKWRATLFREDERDRDGDYARTSTRDDDADGLPDHLHERRRVLTRLTGRRFRVCLGLGLLNWAGARFFFRPLVDEIARGNGGDANAAWTTLLRAASAVLVFYADLFLLAPAARLVGVAARNARAERRNRERARSAAASRVR